MMPRNYKFIIFGVTIAIFIVLVLFFLNKSVPAEGILGRTPPDLRGLDKDIKTKGKCIGSYSVLPAGRDSKGQHYALYLTLVSNPKSEEALSAALKTQECENEAQAILKDAASALGIPADQGLITAIYRNSSGKTINEF